MKKKYMSLIELLCIIAVIGVTANLSATLFTGFIKNSKVLESHQQNQRNFKNIVRSIRIWSSQARKEIKELDGLWSSGENEIYLLEKELICFLDGKKTANKIPKGYELKIDTEKNSFDEPLLVLTARKKDLKYSIKFKVGEDL